VHPPSCFKGLIAGEMHQYWLQIDPITFQDILTKFLKRLLCRGHTLENLISLVKHAASSIDSTITNPIESPSTANITMNIHSVYQPNGLQWHDIRQLYEAILKPHLNFKNMMVAISRPTNLRDMLASAKLQAPPHLDIVKLIADLKQKQQKRTLSSKTSRHVK